MRPVPSSAGRMHRPPTVAHAVAARPGRRTRRQHTPRSPWLSMTRQKMSHNIIPPRWVHVGFRGRLPPDNRCRTAPTPIPTNCCWRRWPRCHAAGRVPLFRRRRTVAHVWQGHQLKRRVSSYFQKNHGGTRIGHMVGKIADGDHGGALRGRGVAAGNNLIKTQNPGTTSCSGTTRAIRSQNHRRGCTRPLPGWDWQLPHLTPRSSPAHGTTGAIDKAPLLWPLPAPGR